MKTISMTTTKLFLLAALGITACGGEATIATPPADGAGSSSAYSSGSCGGAGDGGTAGQAGDTSTGGNNGGTGGAGAGDGGATCDPPTEAFSGFHACWDWQCCTPGNGYDYGFECAVQMGLEQASYYLCIFEPKEGPQTDYRKCEVLDLGVPPEQAMLPCQWGSSMILCCEPI